MFITLTMFDKTNASLGWAQLELSYGSGLKPGVWTLQEQEPAKNGWSRVASSPGKSGKCEVKDNNVVWLWDTDPMSKAQRNIAILHSAPKHEGDYAKTDGFGRIFAPSDSSLKDCRIKWKTPGLSPLRQRVLQILANKIPAYPGFVALGRPNHIDVQKTPYKGKVTNCGVLPGWVAGQLGYYYPGQKRVSVAGEQPVPKDAMQAAPKKNKNDPTEKTVYEAFTGPLAASWGFGATPEMVSYPKRVEQSRGLHANTIWIQYSGDGADKSRRPKPGDIYVLCSSPSGGSFQHVGIIIDSVGSEWRTADLGQCGCNAQAYKRRMFDEAAGTLILDPPETNIPDGGTRWLHGWVDIDQLFSDWDGN